MVVSPPQISNRLACPCDAGFLSDPNIDPAYLGILTMLGVNARRFKPSVAAVKEKYYAKFRMHGTEPAFASQSDGAEP